MKPQFLQRQDQSVCARVSVLSLLALLLISLSGVAGVIPEKETSTSPPVRKFNKIKTKKNAKLPARYKGMLKRMPTMEEEGEKDKLAKGREDVSERQKWFMLQRTYPFKTLSRNVRRDAYDATMTQGFAESVVEVENYSWRAIGPMPSRSAYYDTNWGPLSGRINSIAVAPNNAQLILIGGATGGIWRSTDGGRSFVPVSDNHVDLAVGSIAFSQSDPNIVYAGMGDAHGFYFGSGILKSTDAGKTWKRVNNDSFPEPGTVHKLAVDPNNPNRVYVALFYSGADYQAGGILVSADGGVSWKKTFTGWVNDVAVHPTDANTIYATLSYDPDDPTSSTQGLHRSTDGGQTWKQIYQSAYEITYDIRFASSPANPQVLYVYLGGYLRDVFGVRLVVSPDGGATWTDRGGKGIDPAQFSYNTYLAVDPRNANTVYVGTVDVHRSDDAGRTWENLTQTSGPNGEFNYENSFTHPDQHAIAFSPNSPDVLYFGNDGGFFVSTDRGKTIQSQNNSLALTQFVSYVVHPTNPLISYGGTQDNGTQRRVNGGLVWQDFIGGDGGNVVINPTNPSQVFTTIYYGLGVKVDENGDVLPNDVTTYPELFGEDFGNGNIGFYPPFVGNGVDNRMYFGSYRLFISNDFGDTWYTPGWRRDLTKGAPPGQRPDVINAIAVSRSNTNVIYTGSLFGRAMVTATAGRSWADITAGLPNRTITSITVDRENPAVSYITFSGYETNHVFKTTNAGTSWKSISTGLPDVPVNTFLIDPRNAQTMYVGTDIGVFRSTDGGASWQYFNKGMPPVIVTSLTAQRSGLIQAGTYGRGAFELFTNPTKSQEASQ